MRSNFPLVHGFLTNIYLKRGRKLFVQLVLKCLKLVTVGIGQ